MAITERAGAYLVYAAILSLPALIAASSLIAG